MRYSLILQIVTATATNGRAKQAAADHEDLRRLGVMSVIESLQRKGIVDKAYSVREASYRADFEDVGNWDLVGYKVYHKGEGEDAITSHYTTADANFQYEEAWAAPWPTDGSRWTPSSPRFAAGSRQRATITARVMMMEDPPRGRGDAEKRRLLRCWTVAPLPTQVIVVQVREAAALQTSRPTPRPADHTDQRALKTPLVKWWFRRRRIVDKAYFFREMRYGADSEGMVDWDQVGYKGYLTGEGEDAITSHFTADDGHYLYAKEWAAPRPADGSRWKVGSLRLAPVQP